MDTTRIAPLTVQQLEVLHAGLNSARVKERGEGKNKMSYLEAWDVKATLIRVFGYGGFSAECLESKILRAEQEENSRKNGMNWAISAQATVRLTIPQLGVVYTESAIATNKQPDWGEAADTALKSAESDALKRAAIYLGTQFGLSLYDSGSKANIVKLVRAPGQMEIVDDLNLARVQSPEAEAATARLQARMKVALPEGQDVPAEPVETPAEQPVATVAAPIEKALANADREAAKIEEAERAARPKRTTSTPRSKPAARKSTRTAGSNETVSADRQAVARNALAAAEEAVGMGTVSAPTEPGSPGWGPGDADYFMDDEIQATEDAR